MEQIRNNDFNNTGESTLSNESIEGLTASGMADRGPMAFEPGRSDTDAGTLQPLGNPLDEEGDEDYDDEDADLDEDAIEIDEVDADKAGDDAVIVDEDLDDEDLEDLDLDEEDDEEDDARI